MNSATRKYAAANSSGMVNTRLMALPNANRPMAPRMLLRGTNIQIVGVGPSYLERKVGQRLTRVFSDTTRKGQVQKGFGVCGDEVLQKG